MVLELLYSLRKEEGVMNEDDENDPAEGPATD
jgi:hypothetical protein